MNIKAPIGTVRGSVVLQAIDLSTGSVKSEEWFGNLILHAMRDQILRGLFNASGNLSDYQIATMAWGVSQADFTNLDAAAITPPGSGALVASVTSWTPSEDGLSLAMEATLAAGGDGTTLCHELGLVLHNGYLLSRLSLSPRTKDSQTAWRATWTITYTPPAITSCAFTQSGYAALFAILSGQNASAINRVQFGSGLEPPTLGDSRLQVPIVPIKAITSKVFDDTPGSPVATITAYLLAPEANGFLLSEAGLLTGNGLLAMRGLIPSTSKDSDHSLEFTAVLT